MRAPGEIAETRQASQTATAIFDEDWWLDAVAPGEWDRVRVEWDGVAVGDMAFHVTRRWGLTYIKMPHLTRTMSPRLYPPAGKASTRAIRNQSIVAELLAKLPRHDRFERALNPNCPSLQGFVHANLPTTHMFTFRSATGDCPERMLELAQKETRRLISKAQRECAVERSTDFDRFIRLHEKSYGDASIVDYAIAGRLFEASVARGQAEIVFIRLNDKADTAGSILVWDSIAAYTWLMARNFGDNYPGATSLVFFEAMRTAHRLGLVLDYDGYVRPAVGCFLTRFGLQPAVRPYVNGSSWRWQCLRAATTLIRPNRPDRHFRVA